MIVFYATPATNRKIIKPGAAGALPIDGRIFVQEPNVGHLFAGDGDRPYRLSSVSGAQLITAATASGMASLLRRRIDEPGCPFAGYGAAGCSSRLVFVDELDFRFAERAPNLNTPAWRGRTTRNQTKRVFPNYVPRPKAGQPGYELTKAMAILAAIPFAAGGTYAERVHFYIAPGFVSSIGVGKGPYFNLGRDARPHFRSHEGVRGALRRAGGVWLEMYHFNTSTRTRRPFSTGEWTNSPKRFTRYLTGPGATTSDPAYVGRLHFMMTRGAPPVAGGAPGACRNTARPQTCQFILASLPQNEAIRANGVGEYKMEGDEDEWRAEVKRLFFR